MPSDERKYLSEPFKLIMGKISAEKEKGSETVL